MNFDEAGLWLFNQQLACAPMDVLMVGLTLFAIPAVLLVIARWWTHGERRRAAVLLTVTVISTLVAVLLQFALMRTRPEGVRIVLAAPPFPAFPSGHAMLCFGAATFIALCERRWAFWALFGAGMVAISRVYLGHHFPSDVLLGAMMGASAGAVGYGALYRSGSQTRPRWAWWFWAQMAVVIFAGVGAYMRLYKFSLFGLPHADKLMHFALYGVLAFFWVGWFAKHKTMTVVAVLSGIGIVDEFAQALSPVRSFDLVDLACTLAGIFVFAALGHLAVRHSEKSPKPRLAS